MKKERLLKMAFKIPFPIIDFILLSFPFLYKTNFVRYETGTREQHIQLLIDAIHETKDLQGNIIECGSNRCGTTSILGLFLKSKK